MTTDPTSTRKVLQAIAQHLGVDVGTLRGRERTASTTLARRVAILLLRKRCGSPYRQIGALLGRSHCNVLKVHRRARSWPETLELAEQVIALMEREAQRAARAARLRTGSAQDVDDVLRKAREDAGVATEPRPRAR